MNDEDSEHEPLEETLQDWQPPELLARQQQTAARDARSAERIAKKQRKRKGKGKVFGVPPAGKHKALALAALAVSGVGMALHAVLNLVGPFAAEALRNRGALGLALYVGALAVFAGLCVVFLLPLPRRRMLLTAVLLLQLALNTAQGVCKLLHDAPTTSASSPARGVMATFGATILLLLSPSLWLLLGALRRKSTERFAGMAQMATLLLGLGGMQAAPVLSAIALAQNAGMFLLLCTWPVLARPVLAREVPPRARYSGSA
jgi:hypothetical protein